MIETAIALAAWCAVIGTEPDNLLPPPDGWKCEVLAHWPREEWERAACAVDSESGWDPLVRGIADPRDRGLWQINSRWHPEATDEIAFDWRRATFYARGEWDKNGWKPWKGFAARCRGLV